MTNETIFFTQVASIISFIATIFILYRILVKQKDATIELLNEKASFLKEQLEAAEKKSPDQLANILSSRINKYKDELERLSKDDKSNQSLIEKKETALKKLKNQLEEIKEIASEYFCPYCKSRMEAREFHSEPHEWGDIDHEYISFECGLAILDDKEVGECKNKDSHTLSSD